MGSSDGMGLFSLIRPKEMGRLERRGMKNFSREAVDIVLN